MFQCSSASRKFLNHIVTGAAYKTTRFQCSSASRKFLNRYRDNDAQALLSLFQCSSASRKFLNRVVYCARSRLREVSVLFSEPKIPQCQNTATAPFTPSNAFQCSSASRKFLNVVVTHNEHPALAVSVLFSEPKIPQLVVYERNRYILKGFSALQRAENSSMPSQHRIKRKEKSFSALQRAENSSIVVLGLPRPQRTVFQCSSASRKFLN